MRLMRRPMASLPTGSNRWITVYRRFARIRAATAAFLLGSIVGAIGGCNSSHTNPLAQPTEPVTWTTLAALQQQDVSGPLFLSTKAGELNVVAEYASSPEFGERVDAFDREPIPTEWSNPGREAAKREVVATYRQLIELSEQPLDPVALRQTVETLERHLTRLVDPQTR